MSHYHAVVWVDHREAHVMHISPDDVEKSVVKPEHPHKHLHHKRGLTEGGSVGSGHAPEDQHFYHAVIEALAGAQEILIVGPGQAKLALLKHAQAHDPAVGKLVVGIETVDHPTDGQLVAYARKYFVAKDQML
jgi:stalled ribosome rescue protein Dom34